MSKLHLGYIQGTHGLKGDLKIKNFSKEPDKIFIKDRNIFLNDEKHKITKVKFYKNNYLIQIDNLIHINLVEKYKGYDVYMDRKEIPQTDCDYILDDLIGMKVISNNKEYGTIKDITSNGVYNTLEIEYKKNYYIPLVKEYLDKIDVQKKEIYIKNVEGLII